MASHAPVQVPRVGVPSPASILASLVSAGYLDASAQAEVLQGICALAQAAAQSTQMSFAGFLSHACGAQPDCHHALALGSTPDGSLPIHHANLKHYLHARCDFVEQHSLRILLRCSLIFMRHLLCNLQLLHANTLSARYV